MGFNPVEYLTSWRGDWREKRLQLRPGRAFQMENTTTWWSHQVLFFSFFCRVKLPAELQPNQNRSMTPFGVTTNQVISPDWLDSKEHLFPFPSLGFQNGADLKPGKNCRIYSMGRKRFCQILQCSLADSGTYTCDAGEAETSCSLVVYGKMFAAVVVCWCLFFSF